MIIFAQAFSPAGVAGAISFLARRGTTSASSATRLKRKRGDQTGAITEKK
jgi:hypothetical protein